MRWCVILMLMLSVLSCKKENCKEPEEKQAGKSNATVLWNGPRAVDGLEWVVLIENGKMEKPSNLPEKFQIDNLKVYLTYEPSTEKFPCFCANGFVYMIRINSIEKR